MILHNIPKIKLRDKRNGRIFTFYNSEVIKYLEEFYEEIREPTQKTLF